MRLKKQSMREVRDAGMAARDDAPDCRISYREDERAQQHLKPIERRTYVRGALVKMKRFDTRK